MLLRFGNGIGMGIEKVSHACITSDQNKLFEGWAHSAFFQKPEQSLNRDVHYFFGSLFAGGEMQDMGDSIDRFGDQIAIGNAPADYFQP